MSTTQPTTRPPSRQPSVRAWRNAVFLVFALNGAGMATWVARVPAFREHLELQNDAVGLLLVGVSVGSIVGLLLASQVLHLLGGRRTILVTLIGQSVGLVIAGLGATYTTSFAAVFAGLLLYGYMTSTCDVAMNVEGAGVEHATGKTLLPLMHGMWSVGTVIGAGIGSAAAFAQVPPAIHLGGMAVLVLLAAIVVTRSIPQATTADEAEAKPPLRERLRIWLEPRTLLIGAVMLGMAFAEGAANDWLQIGLIDGRDLGQGEAAAVYAVFVTAMTLGRVVGGPVVDRIGRVPALRAAAVLAFVGLAVVIFVPVVWIDIIAVVVWGVGASLGFPVGMSAAADDPAKAAARVSAVATVAYCAFLAGPPIIGFLGHEFGVLNALILVLGLIALSLLATPAARESGVRSRPEAASTDA